MLSNYKIKSHSHSPPSAVLPRMPDSFVGEGARRLNVQCHLGGPFKWLTILEKKEVLIYLTIVATQDYHPTLSSLKEMSKAPSTQAYRIWQTLFVPRHSCNVVHTAVLGLSRFGCSRVTGWRRTSVQWRYDNYNMVRRKKNRKHVALSSILIYLWVKSKIRTKLHTIHA